jgi:hypothetical protein
MALHAFIAGVLERNLTVTELLPAEESELTWLYQSIDLVGLGFLALLCAGFWALGWRRAFRRTILVYLVLSTLTLVVECSDLISTMTARPSTNEGAFALLWDAALTWGKNVLTFTVWYWFLDQGGPDRRRSDDPGRPDFAFPQQTSDIPGWEKWRPGMFDYLFVAFNTSTAFSPTDTVVLSPTAKLLSMLQAAISLVIIAMLAARVVNTIQ